MQPEHMFVLDASHEIAECPSAPADTSKPPKLSECSPLFLAVCTPVPHPVADRAVSGFQPQQPGQQSSVAHVQAYDMRSAGAVLHSHSVHAVLATLLDESASEFIVTQLEMIKAGLPHPSAGTPPSEPAEMLSAPSTAGYRGAWLL